MSYASKLTMIWILVLILVASLTFADVPRMMNYQGQMSDASGNPLDTTIQMVFTIYDDSTNNNIMWTETQDSVEVINGQFGVLWVRSTVLTTMFSVPWTDFWVSPSGPTPR